MEVGERIQTAGLFAFWFCSPLVS